MGKKSKKRNRSKNKHQQEEGSGSNKEKKAKPSILTTQTAAVPSANSPKHPPASDQQQSIPKKHETTVNATKKSQHEQEPQQTQQQPSTTRRLLRIESGNPFRTKLDDFLSTLLTTEERKSFFCLARVSPERRSDVWNRQADLGEDFVNRYAWVAPDKEGRCMAILKHFEPIVEVGCGANAYWCRQMKQSGIDVVGYDVAPEEGGRIDHNDKNNNNNNDDDDDKKQKAITKKKADDDVDDGNEEKGNEKKDDGEYFEVEKGGPEVLEQHKDRTLFLCYPDENNEPDEPVSLGEACLRYYKGDYIIHVGEVYGDTLSVAQAPWGRSSSPLFQQQLAAEFHCVLKIALPSWLHVNDSLTVWKRTQKCVINFSSEGDEKEEEGDDEAEYLHVPVEERLPMETVAPFLAHLLRLPVDEGGGKMSLKSRSDPKAKEEEDAKKAKPAAVKSEKSDRSPVQQKPHENSAEKPAKGKRKRGLSVDKQASSSPKEKVVAEEETRSKNVDKHAKKRTDKQIAKAYKSEETSGSYQCPW